jgi:nicotinamidase-related amidase
LKAKPGAKTAHLCVDVQRLFSAEGPWPLAWMERVLPKVVKLVERAPSRTIFTRFLTPRSAEDMPGQWRLYYSKWSNVTLERLDNGLLRLVPQLQPYVPPAAVFDKQVYSAFASPFAGISPGRLNRHPDCFRLRDRRLRAFDDP